MFLASPVTELRREGNLEFGFTPSNKNDAVNTCRIFSDGIYGHAPYMHTTSAARDTMSSNNENEAKGGDSLKANTRKELAITCDFSSHANPLAVESTASSTSTSAALPLWYSRVAHFRISPRVPARVQQALWPSAGIPFGPYLRSLELSCCSLYGDHLRLGLGDVLFGLREGAGTATELNLRDKLDSHTSRENESVDAENGLQPPPLVPSMSSTSISGHSILLAIKRELYEFSFNSHAKHTTEDTASVLNASGDGSKQPLSSFLPSFNRSLRVLNLRSCVGVDDSVLTSILAEKPWRSETEEVHADTEGGEHHKKREKSDDERTPTGRSALSTGARSRLIAMLRRSAEAITWQFIRSKQRNEFNKAEILQSSSSPGTAVYSVADVVDEVAQGLESAFFSGNGLLPTRSTAHGNHISKDKRYEEEEEGKRPLPPMSFPAPSSSSPYSAPFALTSPFLFNQINPLYTSLQELYLYGCQDITDDSLLMIRRLGELRVLNLFDCGLITDIGLRHICPILRTSHTSYSSSAANVDGRDEEGQSDATAAAPSSSAADSVQVSLAFSSSPSSALRHLASSIGKKNKYTPLSSVVSLRNLGGGHSDANNHTRDTRSTPQDYSSLSPSSCLDHYLRFPLGVRQLEFLCLDSCTNITDTGIAALSQHCIGLKKLDLNKCLGLTDEGLLFLSKGLPYLGWLRISNCAKITDAGIAAMSLTMRSLWYLRISYCPQVTGIGFGGPEVLRIVEEVEKAEGSSLSFILSAAAVAVRNLGFSSPGDSDEEADFNEEDSSTIARAAKARASRVTGAILQQIVKSTFTGEDANKDNEPPSGISVCFPSLWEVGMDHCNGLTDLGAAVMAIALGGSLKELDWSYCSPGLGCIPLCQPEKGSPLLLPSLPSSGWSSLGVVAWRMRCLKSLYLIGHKYVTNELMLDEFLPSLKIGLELPKGRGSATSLSLQHISLTASGMSRGGVERLLLRIKEFVSKTACAPTGTTEGKGAPANAKRSPQK